MSVADLGVCTQLSHISATVRAIANPKPDLETRLKTETQDRGQNETFSTPYGCKMLSKFNLMVRFTSNHKTCNISVTVIDNAILRPDLETKKNSVKLSTSWDLTSFYNLKEWELPYLYLILPYTIFHLVSKSSLGFPKLSPLAEIYQSSACTPLPPGPVHRYDGHTWLQF